MRTACKQQKSHVSLLSPPKESSDGRRFAPDAAEADDLGRQTCRSRRFRSRTEGVCLHHWDLNREQSRHRGWRRASGVAARDSRARSDEGNQSDGEQPNGGGESGTEQMGGVVRVMVIIHRRQCLLIRLSFNSIASIGHARTQNITKRMPNRTIFIDKLLNQESPTIERGKGLLRDRIGSNKGRRKHKRMEEEIEKGKEIPSPEAGGSRRSTLRSGSRRWRDLWADERGLRFKHREGEG